MLSVVAVTALIAVTATSCKDEKDNLPERDWSLLCEFSDLSYEGPVVFSEAIQQYVASIDSCRNLTKDPARAWGVKENRPYVFVLPDGAGDSCRDRHVAFLTRLIVMEQRWKDMDWKIYVSEDTTYYYQPFSNAWDFRIIP